MIQKRTKYNYKNTLSHNNLYILPPLYISHLSILCIRAQWQSYLSAISTGPKHSLISFSILYIAKCNPFSNFYFHFTFINTLYCPSGSSKTRVTMAAIISTAILHASLTIPQSFLLPYFSRQAQCMTSHTSNTAELFLSHLSISCQAPAEKVALFSMHEHTST